MTHNKKISYMDIASRISGYGFEKKDLDMLVSIYELVSKNEGETDLKQVIHIKSEVNDRHKIKEEEIQCMSCEKTLTNTEGIINCLECLQ